MTASHNPGGPDNDFGIKFNCENGGPAPDQVTNKIYQLSTAITEYKIVEGLTIDISKIGANHFVVIGRVDFDNRKRGSLHSLIHILGQ